MSVATEWWQWPLFPAVIGFIGGLSVAALGAFAARRLKFARGRLHWRLWEVMLIAPKETRGTLKLMQGVDEVEEPHLVKLRLANRGPKDITEDDFQKKEPITVDVGARILEVVDKRASPENPKVTAPVHTGSVLSIGPCMIGKDQTLEYTFLVEGKPVADVQAYSPIPDVDFGKERIGTSPAARAVWIVSGYTAVVAALIAVAAGKQLLGGVALVVALAAALVWKVARGLGKPPEQGRS